MPNFNLNLENNRTNFEVSSVEDIRLVPTLRYLMTQYMTFEHEGQVVISDYSIIAEYNYLKTNNLLHCIFDLELLNNYFLDEYTDKKFD